jgi:hypothetical protein
VYHGMRRFVYQYFEYMCSGRRLAGWIAMPPDRRCGWAQSADGLAYYQDLEFALWLRAGFVAQPIV